MPSSPNYSSSLAWLTGPWTASPPSREIISFNGLSPIKETRGGSIHTSIVDAKCEQMGSKMQELVLRLRPAASIAAQKKVEADIRAESDLEKARRTASIAAQKKAKADIRAELTKSNASKGQASFAARRSTLIPRRSGQIVMVQHSTKKI